MSRQYLLLAVLLVCCLAASDDYYLLVRQWPGTICLNTTCRYLQNFDESILNIHGLWYQGGPSRSCQHPQQCTTTAFDQNALSAQTRSDLTKQWVGVFNDSTSFHIHEWTKHGTCYEYDEIHPSRQLRASPYIDAYFKQTMALNSGHNFIALLAAKGIKPNLVTGYSVDQLYQAIGTSRSNSLLNCKNINNSYFFSSMQLCFSKNWQIVNCACSLNAGAGEVPCPTGKPIFIPPLKR